MRSKSRETLLIEFLIRTAWIVTLATIAITEMFSQKPAFGAEAVAFNTFDVETTKGKVTAANSGRDQMMVKFNGKAIEITMVGMEKAGPKISDQFASLVLMAYDAGTHKEFDKAYKIWLEECGCNRQDARVNKEYFRKAWWVRGQLKKVLPAPVIDELGLRLSKVQGGSITQR